MEAQGGDLSHKRYATSLAEVCARLNAHHAHYVLVGARAVQLWGSARATRDIDILIEKTHKNAQRVLKALSEVGFALAREWVADEIVKRPVTIIGDSPRVDILTVAWSLYYTEAKRSATIFEVEKVKIPTASIPHLIQSKRTGRLQDAADIEALEEIERLRSAGGEGLFGILGNRREQSRRAAHDEEVRLDQGAGPEHDVGAI